MKLNNRAIVECLEGKGKGEVRWGPESQQSQVLHSLVSLGWLGLEAFLFCGVFKQGCDKLFGSQRCSDSWDEPRLCLEPRVRHGSSQGPEMTSVEIHSATPREISMLEGSVQEGEFEPCPLRV